jgi:hypothetical protein
MARQKLIFVLIACLTLGAIGGRTLPPKPISVTALPPRELTRGLTDAEKQEAIEKWFADQHLQKRIADLEYIAEMRRLAMMNELRVNEAQWRIIEPKYENQIRLMKESLARSSNVTRIFSNKDKDLGFKWIKPTEDKMGRALPKTFAELSEAHRNVDMLVDLLRREDTTDEELRKQIDALQQAREKARKEWPKARQELAATLTTPRQEAVFLLLDHID